MAVVDYSGAGVGRVHIEDAAGNRLLTDFAGTDGYFYDARLLGEWASLHWQPDVESGFACALCNLRTGDTLADYYADGVNEQSGSAWAYSMEKGAADSRILYADGTYSTQTYQSVTGWA